MLLVLALPLMVVCAILVKVGDGGPVLFRQTRVGRDGEFFECLKMRSMVVDAEAQLSGVTHLTSDPDSLLFKARRDPRVTRVGAFMRRFSIDELPQLFNVITGDMSLVGPRPALPAEVRRYHPDVQRRLHVRPGMTGLWQVSGRSDLSWDDTVRLDLYYVDNWSIVQDLAIMAKTIHAVLRTPRGLLTPAQPCPYAVRPGPRRAEHSTGLGPTATSSARPDGPDVGSGPRRPGQGVAESSLAAASARSVSRSAASASTPSARAARTSPSRRAPRSSAATAASSRSERPALSRRPTYFSARARAGNDTGTPSTGWVRCSFSCDLMDLPVGGHRVGRVGLDVGEDVRVATHELVDEVARDVVDVEGLARVLLRDAGLEGDLEQEVAELLLHVGRVAALDGLDRLVRLLEEVGHEAGVGLLGVPRAAPG